MPLTLKDSNIKKQARLKGPEAKEEWWRDYYTSKY